MKFRKLDYELHLNEIGEDYDKEEFIIGGKLRSQHFPDRYGTAIRKYDPIAFQVGYNEWKMNVTKN